MNWNVDIRQLGRKQKAAYPSKRTMNLYYKFDRTAAPATALLYVLFVLVLLLGLSKWLVYDRWAAAAQLEEQLTQLVQQNESVTRTLADYDTVRQQYIRYSATDQERAVVDRMELLDLIDRVIRPAAQVTSVTTQGGQILVQFSGVTLERTAQLVHQIEQSPLVQSTSVDTAASQQESSATVDVSLMITTVGTEEETAQ